MHDFGSGSLIARVFFADGPHPSNWNRMRSFGPIHARFDHHPEPVSDHPDLGIMHGAVSSQVDRGYPLLRTCLAEVFRDSDTITLKRHEPHFATFAT